MRVACVQMSSGDDIAANLDVVEKLLEQPAAKGLQLLVLPENFSFMHPDNDLKRQVAKRDVPETVLPFLAEQAVRHNLTIIGGSLLLLGENGKLRNACPVFNPGGSCLGVYDKMHLFDVELSDATYNESAIVQAGSQPLSVDVCHWHIGLSICYDLRFPELYRHYAREGCQILTVPSAFAVSTGRVHWEILLRARAIENQAYILAPAQVGTHPGGRQTYGGSLIVDPWGEVIARAATIDEATQATLIVAELEMERLDEVRRTMPALEHRRMK